MMSEESKSKNPILIKDYILKKKLGIGSYGVVFKVIKKCKEIIKLFKLKNLLFKLF